MEISEIKSLLTLSQVLSRYNLKPDKHLRLNCPFHEDKTPSMQVYYKTHTAYCFSSNCPTHGKSLDVIDFIMFKEKCTKHEAILKAQDFIGLPNPQIPQPKPTPEPTTQERAVFLNKMFTYFKNAVYNSKPAQEYINGRKLDFNKLEIGYNSGQFHHGTRKDETLIKQCLEAGLLIDNNIVARTGQPGYNVFGKYSIVFALRGNHNQVTGLYFRSTVNNKNQKHYYLKDRSGLYPGYPKPETKKLLLTEAIIDAASLLQIPEITANYEILSCYGTNGLTEEHKVAIKDLKQLKEVILFYDGDQAGKEAITKHAETLNQLRPTVKISYIETPENEDVNSLLQGHDPGIFTHLLENRKPVFLSSENILPNKQSNPRRYMIISLHQSNVNKKQVKANTSGGRDNSIPEGYQRSYKLEINLKMSFGLQIGLHFLLGEDIGGELAGPGCEGSRNFSLTYLQSDNKFKLESDGKTINFDYNLGVSIYGLFGVSKSREGGVNLLDANHTIVTNKMYFTEIKTIDGKKDPTTWQMNAGVGLDVKAIFGFGATAKFIFGFSPLDKK